jgi:hypothetical protein
MYAALIDPVNGYAYFIGTYLFKLDLTGPLPVPVGPALNTGQFASGAIDVAAGYAYFPGGTVKRYALGTGSNPVTAAGSLSLSVGATNCLVVDDADPNPANHYAYVLSSGTPAKIVKIALSTFTELGSVTLASGEDKSLLASFADAKKGYAYFVTTPNAAGPNVSRVVKVKMTPGANPPVRIGAVDLDTYAVAGLKDHIVAWEAAYRSARLLGGDKRFVLSTSGHIQALVNPPGPAGTESRSSYRVTDEPPFDAEAWAEAAPARPGSWWPDYDEWLAARSGQLKPAPKRLGGAGFKALAKAPGTYVHAA